MPGELKNPEESVPFHYDPKYDEAPNPFEPGAFDLDGYLQSLAMECLKRKLGQEQLELLKKRLQTKGLFHMNPGDEKFRKEVCNNLNRLAMARKVASNVLRYE